MSRAAEKLFIAQPPLSLQVRHLEEELGAALFLRHPKGVRLTAAGAALLPEAIALLDRAGRLRDLVGQSAHGGIGSITLGYVPSASSTVLPDLVHRLRRDHPGLSIELRELISDEQNDALVSGRIDAGIARGGASHPRVAVACQAKDPFCVAVPVEAWSGAMGTIDLRSLATHPFVAFTRHKGPAYFDQSIRRCTQAGFSPRIRYEASTVHGVLDLVAAGMGVALVPASTALMQPEGVRILPLRGAGQGEVLSLLRRKVDTNPWLHPVERGVTSIFHSMERRVRDALGGTAPKRR